MARPKVEYITLVATDVFTPYAPGEVFTLPADQARKVLDAVPNKVRRFDPAKDEALLKATLGHVEEDEAAPAAE